MAANKQPAAPATRSMDNVELVELVKLAVAEAIKKAIHMLVDDVVLQLTSKTQALVDAQVAVFRSEMSSCKQICQSVLIIWRRRRPVKWRWTADSLHR